MSSKPKKKLKGATVRRTPVDIRLWLARASKILIVTSAVLCIVVVFKVVARLDLKVLEVSDYKVLDVLVYQDLKTFDQIVDSYIGDSLLTIDIAQMKVDLEGLAWIYSVQVRKEWPGKLLFNVEEHEPVAIWNGAYVLNSNGDPLEKPFAEMELAKLIGPNNKAKEVMNHYLEFSQVFSDLAIQITEVEMKPRGSWRLVLGSSLIITLGDRNVLSRSKRVVDLLNSESIDKTQLEYIDARYTNGIAVRYKQLKGLEEVEYDITT